MSETIKLTQFSHGAGCGCKIAPAVLEEILKNSSPSKIFPQLLVGNETKDDAAVYDMGNGMGLISTTDFFTPIVDDAYDFGRIASANALSDVYAMGGTPAMAIAILGWPVDKLPTSEAQKVLAGARAICAQANIPLAGGHSIDSPEPFFGLAVNGFVKTNSIKKNSGAQPGDLLFLTKKIGVGILATAEKRGVLLAEHAGLAVNQMTALNSLGSLLGNCQFVTALTDVTGFGLGGHLLEMCEGSNCSAELHWNKIQFIENLNGYLNNNIIPDATYRNWNAYSSKIKFGEGVNVMDAFKLLPCPETSGGLLIAVSADYVDEMKTILVENNLAAFGEPIGKLIPMTEKTINVNQ